MCWCLTPLPLPWLLPRCRPHCRFRRRGEGEGERGSGSTRRGSSRARGRGWNRRAATGLQCLHPTPAECIPWLHHPSALFLLLSPPLYHLCLHPVSATAPLPPGSSSSDIIFGTPFLVLGPPPPPSLLFYSSAVATCPPAAARAAASGGTGAGTSALSGGRHSQGLLNPDHSAPSHARGGTCVCGGDETDAATILPYPMLRLFSRSSNSPFTPYCPTSTLLLFAADTAFSHSQCPRRH